MANQVQYILNFILEAKNSEGDVHQQEIFFTSSEISFSQNDEVEPLLLAQSEDEQEHLRNTEKQESIG